MIGEISAVTTAFLWSSTNIMIKSASDRLGVIPVNALRTVAGALFVVIALFVAGRSALLSQVTVVGVAYLVISVLIGLGLGDTIYFRSMMLLGASRASPISNVYPLFALPFAIVFLDEALTWLNVVGTLLVVGGVYLVARSAKAPETGSQLNAERFRHEGLALALSAPICWTLSTALLKLALVDLDVFVANFVRMPVAALVLVLLAAKSGNGLNFRAHGWRPLLSSALAGILSIGVGSMLYLLAVQTAGVAKTAALSSTAPVFSIPLSMIFLREKLTASLAAGTAISIAGVWLLI